MKQGDIIRTLNGVKWVVAASIKDGRIDNIYNCVLVSISPPYKKYVYVEIGTVLNVIIHTKYKSINGSTTYRKIGFSEPKGTVTLTV